MKNLTEVQKEQIKKDFPKKQNSKKQHFFIPSENDVLTDREFDLYNPNYSQNKAMNDGYVIPFVPYFDL